MCEQVQWIYSKECDWEEWVLCPASSHSTQAVPLLELAWRHLTLTVSYCLYATKRHTMSKPDSLNIIQTCDTRMLFYTRYTTAIFYYTVIRMHVLLIGLLTWFLNKTSLPEILQYVICYHLYVVIIFPIFPTGSITYKCSLVLALTQFNPLQKPCK